MCVCLNYRCSRFIRGLECLQHAMLLWRQEDVRIFHRFIHKKLIEVKGACFLLQWSIWDTNRLYNRMMTLLVCLHVYTCTGCVWWVLIRDNYTHSTYPRLQAVCGVCSYATTTRTAYAYRCIPGCVGCVLIRYNYTHSMHPRLQMWSENKQPRSSCRIFFEKLKIECFS